MTTTTTTTAAGEPDDRWRVTVANLARAFADVAAAFRVAFQQLACAARQAFEQLARRLLPLLRRLDRGRPRPLRINGAAYRRRRRARQKRQSGS